MIDAASILERSALVLDTVRLLVAKLLLVHLVRLVGHGRNVHGAHRAHAHVDDTRLASVLRSHVVDRRVGDHDLTHVDSLHSGTRQALLLRDAHHWCGVLNMDIAAHAARRRGHVRLGLRHGRSSLNDTDWGGHGRAAGRAKLALIRLVDNHVYLAVRLGAVRLAAYLALVRLLLQMNQLMVALEIALPAESRAGRAESADKHLGCLDLADRVADALWHAAAVSTAQRTRAVARVADGNVAAKVLRIGKRRRTLWALQRLSALRIIARVRAGRVARKRLLVPKRVAAHRADVARVGARHLAVRVDQGEYVAVGAGDGRNLGGAGDRQVHGMLLLAAGDGCHARDVRGAGVRVVGGGGARELVLLLLGLLVLRGLLLVLLVLYLLRLMLLLLRMLLLLVLLLLGRRRRRGLLLLHHAHGRSLHAVVKRVAGAHGDGVEGVHVLGGGRVLRYGLDLGAVALGRRGLVLLLLGRAAASRGGVLRRLGGRGCLRARIQVLLLLRRLLRRRRRLRVVLDLGRLSLGLGLAGVQLGRVRVLRLLRLLLLLLLLLVGLGGIVLDRHVLGVLGMLGVLSVLGVLGMVRGMVRGVLGRVLLRSMADRRRVV